MILNRANRTDLVVDINTIFDEILYYIRTSAENLFRFYFNRSRLKSFYRKPMVESKNLLLFYSLNVYEENM